MRELSILYLCYFWHILNVLYSTYIAKIYFTAKAYQQFTSTECKFTTESNDEVSYQLHDTNGCVINLLAILFPM